MNKFQVHLASLSVVFFLVLVGSAQASTLDLFLSGGTITSGDEEFYGFTGYSSSGSGGAFQVPASDINVTPTTVNGATGLQFQSPFLYAGANQGQEIRLQLRRGPFDRPRQTTWQQPVVDGGQRRRGRQPADH